MLRLVSKHGKTVYPLAHRIEGWNEKTGSFCNKIEKSR